MAAREATDASPSFRFLRRRGLRQKSRQLIAALTPTRVFYEQIHRRAQRARTENSPNTFDHHWIDIDEGSSIVTFWSVSPPVGSGPAASVYVLDSEVLRLDCFGGERGHMHLNPRQLEAVTNRPARIFFPPGEPHEHVELAEFELARNLPAALAANGLERVQNYPVDASRLQVAAEEMRQDLLKLLKDHQ